MKVCRHITGLVAFLLALASTQCASVQEIEAPRPAQASFEVYAVTAETRTVNDGMATRWETGDRFSLFHAPAGTTSFTSDGAFAVDDPETGHAKGSVSSLGAGSQDWYMAYPYAAGAVSPAAVPVTVGAAAGTAQVQAGGDAMAHLAGPAVPLWGKAPATAASATPTLSVAPAVAVLAVTVTNPGEASVKVAEVKFEAPEAIVGAFTLDVTGEAPVFTAVDASNEAVLSVSGDATLKPGESAVFYLAVKPFTAGAGTQLVLSVNGQERIVTLSRPVPFTAGKIKSLTMTLDKTAPAKSYFYKRVTSVTAGRKYIFVAEDANAGNVLRMAHPLPEGTASGRLDAEDVTDEDGIITLTDTDNAFLFGQAESGYTIRQPDGRYLYNNSSDNAYAGTQAGAGYYWTVTFDEGGLASVLNLDRSIQYNPTGSVRKFQIRRITSTTGAKPRLYELQNDDEAVEEFLGKTVPGVYAYGTEEWLYADGTHQTAVQSLASLVTFRMYQPAEYIAVQVSGIPAGVAVGDRFSVRMTRYVKQVLTHSGVFTVTAVKVEDGAAWLMADTGTGFLVLIQ